MPRRLFRRRVALTVGTTRIVGLNVDFDVVRTITREPNTLEARVSGLSASTRGAWRELADARVKLEAGYENQISTIFLGDLRSVRVEQSGAEIVTIVEAGDGEKAQVRQRFNRAYQAGTSLRTVLEDLVRSLGLEIGNASQTLLTSQTLEGNAAQFEEGIVVVGNASDELTRLLESNGLRWSIQDGVVQVIGVNAALRTTAIRLAPETGLLGVPSIDNKRRLKAQTLLLPDLFPGRKVQLDSVNGAGFFRVDKTQHRGSLFGNDFTVTLEGREL